jgi:hypothetical protein
MQPCAHAHDGIHNELGIELAKSALSYSSLRILQIRHETLPHLRYAAAIVAASPIFTIEDGKERPIFSDSA